MNKKSRRFTLYSLILVGIGATVPFLLGNSCIQHTPMVQNQHTTPPEVPAYATFAGDTIRFDRYDLRERMDRELISFTYMQSGSLLMLKRANRYFPVIEPILKVNGIPDDFKYLMAIESSANPSARSNAGAAGLWQFMPATGREFGLEVNGNIDERYHIEKSTRAACRYLRQAYSKFGDWISVAASYNAGQGRISSQLAKQQCRTAADLWLNEETSRYIFRILAAKQFFAAPADFGFRLTAKQLYPPFTYTTDTVRQPIDDLYEYARQKGISYAQLHDANLWLRESKLNNKTQKEYVIKIPTQNSIYYNPERTVAYPSIRINP